MKTALMLSAASATGRKRRRTMPAEKVHNFSSVFKGLRSDTDYVITISFVLSGRKLGSESFTILSHDGSGKISSRKHSAASNDPSRRGSIADALGTPR